MYKEDDVVKAKEVKDKGCVWESLSIAYLSLSSHISTFDKNYRCLEELIKIAYDSSISHF